MTGAFRLWNEWEENLANWLGLKQISFSRLWASSFANMKYGIALVRDEPTKTTQIANARQTRPSRWGSLHCLVVESQGQVKRIITGSGLSLFP